MAKKSFKDNPALQFITAAEAEAQPEEREPIPAQPRPAEKPPEGYKLNPAFIETKSRRLQLVLQPSLYERVKTGAAAAGLSVNEYVHQLLDNATREE